ncbi:MAG TPA: hypothetical protein VJ749_13460 [Pyrinomonadaceae bacterium]|jgi:hypothetical protein|nr:hypothetical protein [Pyrinomonadaceae bacterium]
MSDRNNETLNVDPAVDPPNNDGGTTTTTKTAGALDSASADALAVDPPNNDGGTGK